MNIPPEIASILGALGTAAVLLIRTGARWLRYRMLREKVRREAKTPGGPEFGTAGFVWGEIVRERGARHVLARDLWALAQRVARLEGRTESGEQMRVSFTDENDTDRDSVQMPEREEDPRTPADSPAARRAARRSRP